MSRIFGSNNNKKQKFGSNHHNNNSKNDDVEDEMDESTSGFFGSIDKLVGSSASSSSAQEGNNQQQRNQTQNEQPQQKKTKNCAFLEGATDRTIALQQKSGSSVLGKRGAAKQQAAKELASRGGAGVKVEGLGNRTILPAIGTRLIASADEWKTTNPLARETAEKKMLTILKQRYLEKEVEKRRNKAKASSR